MIERQLLVDKVAEPDRLHRSISVFDLYNLSEHGAVLETQPVSP